MNVETKNLHTGYRQQCTALVPGEGKTRKRVRKEGAMSFKDWVRDQPEADRFFRRRKQGR